MFKDDVEKFDALARQLIAGKKVQYSFDICFEAATGEKFSGPFVVHRPTVGEKIRIGVLDARIRQELQVDAFTSNMSYMIATLMVVVDSSPEWWEPGRLFDYDLILAVYMRYVEWANSFFRRAEGEHQGNQGPLAPAVPLDDNEARGTRRNEAGITSNNASDGSEIVRSDGRTNDVDSGDVSRGVPRSFPGEVSRS